jgi:hypothetical protein
MIIRLEHEVKSEANRLSRVTLTMTKDAALSWMDMPVYANAGRIGRGRAIAPDQSHIGNGLAWGNK